jgi:hypothetical protein
VKAAQYPAAAGLVNDAKRHHRPVRDDRNGRLLVLRAAQRLPASVDRPVRDGYLFKNANPVRCGGYWATFVGSLWDDIAFLELTAGYSTIARFEGGPLSGMNWSSSLGRHEVHDSVWDNDNFTDAFSL